MSSKIYSAFCGTQIYPRLESEQYLYRNKGTLQVRGYAKDVVTERTVSGYTYPAYLSELEEQDQEGESNDLGAVGYKT